MKVRNSMEETRRRRDHQLNLACRLRKFTRDNKYTPRISDSVSPPPPLLYVIQVTIFSLFSRSDAFLPDLPRGSDNTRKWPIMTVFIHYMLYGITLLKYANKAKKKKTFKKEKRDDKNKSRSFDGDTLC